MKSRNVYITKKSTTATQKSFTAKMLLDNKTSLYWTEEPFKICTVHNKITSSTLLVPLDRNYTEVNGIVVTLRSPSFDSSIPPFSLQPSRSLKNSVKYSLTHSLPPSEQALDAQNHFTFSLLKKTTLFNSCSCKLFACIQPADRMNAQTVCACAHRMYMWVII